jgi:hypothetical protein
MITRWRFLFEATAGGRNAMGVVEADQPRAIRCIVPIARPPSTSRCLMGFSRVKNVLASDERKE